MGGLIVWKFCIFHFLYGPNKPIESSIETENKKVSYDLNVRAFEKWNKPYPCFEGKGNRG